MARKKPLAEFLKVQTQAEQDVLFALKRAAASADAAIKALSGREGIGAKVRVDQLKAAKAAALRGQADLWDSIGATVQAGRARSAAAAVDVMQDYSSMLLTTAFTPFQQDALLRAAQVQAQGNIESMLARVTGKSYIPLSQQVYKTRALSERIIDRRVEQALGRGASWKELADSVKDLIRPDTPGGVAYAAKRLGRTELNNAFHAVTKESGQAQPWVTGMEWHLSGSHNRPDECNAYDGQIFAPKDLPDKPHPNCLCFVTPEVVPRDEFIRRYQAGEYDEHLDRVMMDAGYPPRPMIPVKCP